VSPDPGNGLVREVDVDRAARRSSRILDVVALAQKVFEDSLVIHHIHRGFELVGDEEVDDPLRCLLVLTGEEARDGGLAPCYLLLDRVLGRRIVPPKPVHAWIEAVHEMVVLQMTDAVV
jgi:hypothetical protein